MNAESAKLEMDVSVSHPSLVISVELDGLTKWQGSPKETEKIEIAISDEENSHELIIRLSGKTEEHTKLNEHGQIIEDALAFVSNIAFDEIKIDQIVHDHAIYTHDFNGHGEETADKFFGIMGCNGTVRLPFNTPVYLWLLENM